MIELKAMGVESWTCARPLFNHAEENCGLRPDWVVFWPQLFDDAVHIVVAVVCDEHHRDAVHHASGHTILVDGATSSMGAPWGELRQVLAMIHGSHRSLRTDASVTFAFVPGNENRLEDK